MQQVGKAIRAYLTRNLQKPTLPAVAAMPLDTADYAGWYQPDSPRDEMTNFLERLAIISLVRFKDGKLLFTFLGGWNREYVPVSRALFRYVPEKDPPQPVPTLALLDPNADGRFIQAGMGTTMKRIPTWLAVLEAGITVFVLLSFVSIPVYAPFWLLGGLSRKRRRPAERGMRIWPLIGVLSVFGSAAIFIWDGGDGISRLGNLTMWSVGVCVGTVMFAVAAIASAIAVWRAPADGVRRYVRTYSITVTAALLIAAAYLAYWGIIGFRSWA